MSTAGQTESEQLEQSLRPRLLADQAIRAIAEQAADHAAQKAGDIAAQKAVALLMLHFGVDINDPVQIREFKEHIEFLKRAARGAGVIKTTVVRTCVGAAVTGFLAILFLGLKDWVATLGHH